MGMQKSKIKRRVVKIDTSNQLRLFGEQKRVGNDHLADIQTSNFVEKPQVKFKELDPRALLLNQVRIDEYLNNVGQTTALQVRSLLDRLNWSAFEAEYNASGRQAYSPQAMMGIILLGIMQGISSLRRLEQFARLDIGCLWVSGGILPDHSIIGRFVQKHETQLSNEFFDQLTREVLKATGTGTCTVAGDGTVIEAAASRFSVMKEEALNKATARVQEQLAQTPNPQDESQLEKLKQADEVLQKRKTARKAQGKATDKVQVCTQETDAVIQPQKDKHRFAASYKPSVLANDKRVILGIAVDPSSETGVVASLLSQAMGLGKVETALFDAGYFSGGVIKTTTTNEIELLCPEGQSRGKNWNKQSTQYYLKNQFEYDAKSDTYRCPQGQTLVVAERYKGNKTSPAYQAYTSKACAQCLYKKDCTRSSKGRKIKRYDCDDAKDILRKTMQQDEVRERYLKRQAMVEPVFSHLRYQQGLNRFRRKGLAAVKLEFALHAMAYNLSRVTALCRAPGTHPSSLYSLIQLFIACITRILRFQKKLQNKTSLNPNLKICSCSRLKQAYA